MDAGRPEHETSVTAGDRVRPVRRLNRLADADEGDGSRLARTRDHALAIVVERVVGQVCVAVDERGHDGKTAALERAAAPGGFVLLRIRRPLYGASVVGASRTACHAWSAAQRRRVPPAPAATCARSTAK